MDKMIAVIKNMKELKYAIESKSNIIFILRPNIKNLKEQVHLIHESDKKIFVYIDLAEGIGKDEFGINYIKGLGVDGIISAHADIIKLARKIGMHTVQRFFIVDTDSIASTVDAAKSSRPDMIEIMPGTVSKIINSLEKELDMPIVAGGLIDTKEEIIEALASGARAVSTEKPALWEIW